jgi:integrase
MRGTLGWLVALYFGSDEFAALDPQSQRTRRNIIEECLREPVKAGSPELMRDCPLAFITTKKVKRLRDLRAGKPGAANNRRKWLSAMFGWAVEENIIASNPARDVRRIRYPSEGFHTWSIEEVRRYQAHHHIGTKARLALSLLLFVGVRRGDMVELGRQHVRDGWIRFVPKKTKRRSAVVVEVPMIPELQRVIAASYCGDLTFLENERGRGFTAAGFGNKFREWCDEAGLPECSAHGLRKAGATIAAENGATEHQLMAMYGWTTPGMAAVYTRAANRKRLAGETMGLLAIGSDQTENKDCRTFLSTTVAPK